MFNVFLTVFLFTVFFLLFLCLAGLYNTMTKEISKDHEFQELVIANLKLIDEEMSIMNNAAREVLTSLIKIDDEIKEYHNAHNTHDMDISEIIADFIVGNDSEQNIHESKSDTQELESKKSTAKKKTKKKKDDDIPLS